MARIEQVVGFTRSVDTDKKELVLAIQIVPSEPDTRDESYLYDLPDMTEDRFIELIGKRVTCTISGGIIKRLAPV